MSKYPIELQDFVKDEAVKAKKGDLRAIRFLSALVIALA